MDTVLRRRLLMQRLLNPNFNTELPKKATTKKATTKKKKKTNKWAIYMVQEIPAFKKV